MNWYIRILSPNPRHNPIYIGTRQGEPFDSREEAVEHFNALDSFALGFRAQFIEIHSYEVLEEMSYARGEELAAIFEECSNDY